MTAKTIFNLLLCGVLITAGGVALTGCNDPDVAVINPAPPPVAVNNAVLCDTARITPNRMDDCDVISGYYYRPGTSTIYYRSAYSPSLNFIPQPTVIVHDYRGLSSTGYRPGQTVVLPRPLSLPAAGRASSHKASTYMPKVTRSSSSSNFKGSSSSPGYKSSSPSRVTRSSSSFKSSGSSFRSSGRSFSGGRSSSS